MAETGYIKLHRKLLNWEWIEDPNVLSIFIICLLKANHKANTWKGINIPAGSFITSYEKLSSLSGLSVRQVRVSLDKLKMTGELTSKSTNRYSIITIKNWELYQTNDKQLDKQIDKQLDSPHVTQMTTNKNDKEYKNIYNYNSLINDNNYRYYSSDFLEKSPSQDSVQKKTKVFVKPTIEEIKQFCTENNKNVDAESFYNFYESKNWMIGKNKMQKWKAAVCTWDRKNKVSKPSEPYKQTVPVYSNEIED